MKEKEMREKEMFAVAQTWLDWIWRPETQPRVEFTWSSIHSSAVLHLIPEPMTELFFAAT